MKKLYYWAGALLLTGMTACSDDENKNTPSTDPTMPDSEYPEWYYTGGKLGTAFLSTFNAYEQPTPAVENQGLESEFKNGESLFEHPYMSNGRDAARTCGSPVQSTAG